MIRSARSPSQEAIPENLLSSVLHEEAFERLLSRETERAIRYRDVFSVCLLKPDLSDDLGGGAERLRQAVSDKVGQFLRSTDLVGHVAQGIAVILLNTSGRDATGVAERIRSNIEQVAFSERPEGPPRRLTVSVGEISFPHDGHSETLLLLRARANLQEAALRGGNQVVYGAGNRDEPSIS